jgi:uncharacterized protein YjbJ (UPF0337 family)
MGNARDLKQRIVGNAKQAIGEIIGDQSLHEDGKAQAAAGRDERKQSGGPGPPNESTS